MTLVHKDGSTVTDFEALRPEPEPDVPSTGAVVGSAIRQENIVASTLSDRTLGLHASDIEDGYNTWDDIKDTKYEEYWESFAPSNNSRYSDALKAQIDMEEQDRRNVQAGGATGIVASVAGGIVDLPSLVPGLGIVRGVKGGYSVAKSALAVGASGAVDASASEAVLQKTQQIRPIEESLVAIGFGTVIAGGLGATVAKVVGAKEVNRLTRQLAEDSDEFATTPNVDDFSQAYDNMMASGGAAATPRAIDPEGVDFANKAQAALGKVAILNPMISLLKSKSKAAKLVTAQLPEMSFAMKMTNTGESQPVAAETLVKEWTQGRVGLGLRSLRSEFKAAKQAGETFSRKEFSDRVSRAMRRNDTDPLGSDYVSRAAVAWRKNLVEPLKNEAIAAKLLPEDVQVTTADSYFTRMYKRDKIIAQELEFKDIVRQWANSHITDIDARAGKQSFVSLEDRSDYIEDVVNEIYGKVTGRENPGGTAFVRVANERGPLKERTFNIDDELIEDFLENDVELVMRRYARVMGADVELAKKFGRADMQDQINEVKLNYDDMRAKVQADRRLKPETREKRLKALRADESKDIKNIQGLRDQLRGTHYLDENMSNFGKALQVANTFNYLRFLGGVVPSSFSDIGRHTMVHGPGRFMKDGLVPLITNMKGWKMSVAEAKSAGSAAEVLNNTRMATLAELSDPYGYEHPFMRFVANLGNQFSKLNGMVYWNDFHKSFASVMSQNRILDNAERAFRNGFDSLSQSEQQYMGLLSLGRGDAERIGKMFAEHGEMQKSVRIANTESWGADVNVEAYNLMRLYRAAINKEVDTTIVTKGIGDAPLIMSHPGARSVFQFKSFMIASHQRMLMRATTDEHAGVMSGLMVSIGIGMMVYAFKMAERGKETSDNPGKWLAEGIDRSGVLGPLMEFNNMAEKLNAPGIYSTAQGLFPNKDQSAPASRYAQRNFVGSLAGPSFGLAQTLVEDFSWAFGDKPMSESQKRNNRALMPGQNLPVIKSILHAQ